MAFDAGSNRFLVAYLRSYEIELMLLDETGATLDDAWDSRKPATGVGLSFGLEPGQFGAAAADLSGDLYLFYVDANDGGVVDVVRVDSDLDYEEGLAVAYIPLPSQCALAYRKFGLLNVTRVLADLVRRMLTRWGMGSLGPVTLYPADYLGPHHIVAGPPGRVLVLSSVGSSGRSSSQLTKPCTG